MAGEVTYDEHNTYGYEEETGYVVVLFFHKPERL